MNRKKMVALTSMLVFLGSAAGAGMFDAIKKPAAASAGGPSVDGFLADKDKLVKGFSSARLLFVEAKGHALDAFGLKTEYATSLSEATALATGNVNEESNKAFQTKSQAADDAIKKKMAEGTKLSDEAKGKMTESLKSFAKGTAAESALVATVGLLAKNSSDVVKNAPPLQKPSALEGAKIVAFLAPVIPQDVKEAGSTLKTYIEYCKSQNVEVPKDATLALDGE